MTTTCTACGAAEQSGAFCTVCGTPTVATPHRAPGAMSTRLEATTEPELRESTRHGVAGMLRAGAAAQAGPPLAGVGRRAGAYVLDVTAVSLVAGVVAVLVALATGVPDRYAALGAATTALGLEAATSELLAALGVVYGVVGLVGLLGWVGLALADGLTGRTPGNALLGVRTVAVDGEGPVGVGRGLLRWLVLALCGVLPLVGTVLVLVSPTFDGSGRRQGWHDKAARALVRDVRGVPPRSFAPATAAPASESASATAPPPADRPAEPSPTSAASAAPRGAVGTDPWSFPAAAQRDLSGGVITGVPGVSPAPESAPQPAPQQTPAEQSPAPASAPAPAPAPAQYPADAVGPVDAPLDDDLEATRFSVSSRRSEGSATVPPRMVVEIGPDRRVHVTTRALVGRNPQQDAGPAATLLRVEDATRSVSKTHLELVPTTDGLRVTDLASTNGSAAIAPDGSVRELVAGEPVTVTAGWVVQAGERRLTVIGSDGGA
ncbi:RDD family protein [Isoptericola sp. S6320L]|uniref:RDD family protein n=1 Tax=Isoptericola sp. S6320L TaxID=2926411 RepID=UPI001FF6DA2D|nr:RDD family protein [Isoptericola sp. S6320L]MCK0118045.1 RDD family protein [Isoptericola sp. S6320L]